MMAVGLQRASLGGLTANLKVQSPVARFDADSAARIAEKAVDSVAPDTAKPAPTVQTMPGKPFEWADTPSRLRPSTPKLPAPVDAGPDILVDQPILPYVATNPIAPADKLNPRIANLPAPIDPADAGDIAVPPAILVDGGPALPFATRNLPGALPQDGRLDPTAKTMPGRIGGGDVAAPPAILIADGAPAIVATNTLSPAAKQPAGKAAAASEPAVATATRPAGAARAQQSSELRAALDALRKEAAMTPAERVRRDVLKENKLTEDDVKAMSAEDRKAVEEKIAPVIEKRLATITEQAQRKRVQAAG